MNLETESLVFRQFKRDDVVPLYEIQCDQESMQYTYVAKSLDDSRSRLIAYAEQFERLGYAPWTVLLKSNLKIIGWGGLNIDPFDPGWGTEIAYFFHPDYWGKGYATQLVQIALNIGLNELGLSEINAYAHKDNIASIRVLEKCGFLFQRFEPKLGRNHYRIKSWKLKTG
ncbi:MAG: GNAT family N-acetyltransferase [Desulfobacteraceae bacterium]|nr:GNAT family N-acetyltransferase [Desulfobacteraceae bacterium]